MSGADTIFAPATAPGPSGIAVVRVSGPRAGAALAALTGGRLPRPRYAARAVFLDPESGEALDDGLALWFPAPKSFTGENVAEIHVHGGPAVVQAILRALGGVAGLRPAEPGEFARRAFLNGKLDLTAVEGLADLISAETEAQRRQALRQANGALARLYDGWRDVLIRALAHWEATIDFATDEVPEETTVRSRLEIAALDSRIADHLADGRRGERLRSGIEAVIVGAPNAGKSSLINALARREVAIVSTLAGTTRDVLEVHLDIEGFPLTLADTAGLRERMVETEERDKDDPHAAIEAEGMRRALARAAEADLKIAVFEAPSWPATDPETLALVEERTIVVLSKCDLRRPPDGISIGERPAIPVSVRTGEGVKVVIEALGREACARFGSAASPGPTRERHRKSLENCRAAIGRFLSAAAPELAAEDLRAATRALGRITGRVDVEDLLDAIFKEFCIGK